MQEQIEGEILYKLGAIEQGIQSINKGLSELKADSSKKIEQLEQRVSTAEKWIEGWKVRFSLLVSSSGVIAYFLGDFIPKLFGK